MAPLHAIDKSNADSFEPSSSVSVSGRQETVLIIRGWTRQFWAGCDMTRKPRLRRYLCPLPQNKQITVSYRYLLHCALQADAVSSTDILHTYQIN